jgi:hypothetical protein
MIVSPFYDEIKARAIDLLDVPAGFNGHSQEEMRSRKLGRWAWRNSVGVALCYARDELEMRLRDDGTVPLMNIRKVVRFNASNFRRAEAEISRQFLRLTRRSTMTDDAL